MVLGYAFDKLIESLNEISNLSLVSIAEGMQVLATYILAAKIETL
jgi:hypothetical protein